MTPKYGINSTEELLSWLKAQHFSPDTSLEKYLNKDIHKGWYYKNDPAAPYALLSNMSQLFDVVDIYDIGTFEGLSAVALSSNQYNNVISYDIVNYVTVTKPHNVEFKIGNFFEDPKVLQSPLISFDTDPHDGVIEAQFHKWVLEKEYHGWVVYDDIHLNPMMRDFWASIETEKYDLTDIGHYSGTGLVVY